MHARFAIHAARPRRGARTSSRCAPMENFKATTSNPVSAATAAPVSGRKSPRRTIRMPDQDVRPATDPAERAFGNGKVVTTNDCV